jgi:hypothetical protein
MGVSHLLNALRMRASSNLPCDNALEVAFRYTALAPTSGKEEYNCPHSLVAGDRERATLCVAIAQEAGQLSRQRADFFSDKG